MKKLLLIDGSSLLHRAFYALPILSNSQGKFTNALHGMMTMLGKSAAKHKPSHMVVCFDKARITFRNQIDAEYKQHRKETPQELREQFASIKEILSAAHISWLEMQGFEADDLLGTLAKQGALAGFEVEILSGDRDILQLVDDKVSVFLTKKGITNLDRYDREAIFAKYNLSPQGLIDLKALMGDSSDNISGVPGIGEKTAAKLLDQFSSLQDIYDNIEQVSNQKLRQKLLDNKDKAFISYQLATIKCDIDLDLNWDDFSYSGKPTPELYQIYQDYELKQLLSGLKPIVMAQPLFEEDIPFASENQSPLPEEISLQAMADLALQKQSLSLYAQIKSPAWQGNWQQIALACDNKVCLFDSKLNPQLPDLFWQLLANPAIKKNIYNSKDIALLALANQATLAGLQDDPLLAAYIINPSLSDYPLAGLAAIYHLHLPNNPTIAAYAIILEQISAKQNTALEQADSLKLYHDIELPLSLILAKMEHQGIKVDAEQLGVMSELLDKTAKGYEQTIYQLAGTTFNINSPKQLSEILFDKLQLPPHKKTKTGFSTDAETLEILAADYQIAAQITEYRSCFKLKTTYTDGLKPLIDANGKIHTSFKQTVTATGRLSSAEPNLQNIPVRQEMGRKIRAVFSAENPGDLLLAADYNQIELRVLADISGDDGLKKAFLEGIDIHALTASEVLNIPLEQVDAQARRQAKAVNFGIVYGISDYGLARDLGISRDQAHQYIERYFERYPQVAAYQANVIEQGKLNGYVSTMLNRRRPLPDLGHKNFNIRSFAERMAINTPIQGSAADIIKLAMIDIENKFNELNLKSKMILQVHDELIFNMVAEEKDLLPQLVKQLMENTLPLSIPLNVDLKEGYNWYQMNKILI